MSRYAIDCLNEADKILGQASAKGAKAKPTVAELNRVWELIRNARAQIQHATLPADHQFR